MCFGYVQSVKSNRDEHININNSICLAIDGNSFNIVVNHHQDLIPKVWWFVHDSRCGGGCGLYEPILSCLQLLVYGKVFARVSPSQKQLLVEELQGIG